MAKKFSTKLKEGNWVDWEDDVKIRLRPYPMSKVTIGSEQLDGNTSLEMFKYCVVDWEGIIDEDDKPIPCNDKMKQYAFDHFSSLVRFVMDTIAAMISEDKEIKN